MMAREPTRPAAARPGAFNPAREAAEKMRPRIEELHRKAERVAEDRRRIIETITDPSLRRSVR